MMTNVNSFSSAVKSTGIAARSMSVINDCVSTIHVRRRPKRSEEITSTIGPITHLNAHGR